MQKGLNRVSDDHIAGTGWRQLLRIVMQKGMLNPRGRKLITALGLLCIFETLAMLA